MSSAKSPTHDVFLCHNSRDKLAVRELARQLTSRGLRVWLDESEIRPGTPNMTGLESGLRNSATIAVLCSPGGPGPWAMEEIGAALQRAVREHVYVIPVLLPGDGTMPELPLFLQTRTWVDLRAGLTEDGLGRLCWGITGERPNSATTFASNPDVAGSATSIGAAQDSGDDDELLHLQQEEMELRERGAGQEALQVVWRAMEALKRERRESGNPVYAGAVVANRYVLRAELGHGGFGSVWRAWDREARAVVAVKILHHHLARSEERVQRFWRGAKTMARLQHPGIVRVLATDLELSGTPCFVMEYVPGGDLTAVCRAGQLEHDRALEILQALCEAVGVAHRDGVVHRDIKPDNVLLDAAGTPKLTDFDLVQAAGTSGATRGGMGSVLYCAREQMRDASTVDVRADVFSLGMVGVYMLGGERAVESVYFDASTVAKFVADAQLARVLTEACAAQVETRLASVTALLEGVQELGREVLASATQPSLVGESEGDTTPRSFPSVKDAGLSHDVAAPWADETSSDEHGQWARVRVGDVDVRFRYIEPGTFLMGSPESEEERDPDEDQHNVTLTQGYWLGETVVTQALWATITGKRPSYFEGDDLPVEHVSWNDVQKFVASLNREKPGLEVRLPTEAEWEYACRAGTTEASYSAKLYDIAWYDRNSGDKTHPVGLKEPNAWGLYDMLGNVWEWCSDRWQDHLRADEVDPSGPPEGRGRVLRGGSWDRGARLVRAAYRLRLVPGSRNDFLGLRLARGHQASRESK